MEKARELAIKILNIFEDMLAEKGIYIPDECREWDEDEGCLFGATYYDLEDEITELLQTKIKF